ncbi:MAG: hypothetical protein R2831_00960 [Chitinophagaceae bacterium]
MTRIKHYHLLGVLFYFTSCNLINPVEDIPTYIQIDSVQVVSTVPQKHGSVSHKISDVWVYYDYQLLGAFELPAKIPVLANERGQLQVLAGIWDNGISATRTKYPFYTVDTFTFTAQKGETIKHIPAFYYRTADTPAIAYAIENFEQGNSFQKNTGSDTSFIRTNEPSEVFEGDWSGKIALHDTIDYIEAITIPTYYLKPNKQAYLELNYKSDINIQVYTQIQYQGTTYNQEIIGLKARENWNKTYLNLSGFASTYQNAAFKFYIKATKPSEKDSATIYIDNFKIIYFN